MTMTSHMQYHKLAAEAFYLMAIVYDKLGQLDHREAAAKSFRKHITSHESSDIWRSSSILLLRTRILHKYAFGEWLFVFLQLLMKVTFGSCTELFTRWNNGSNLYLLKWVSGIIL